jgi:protein-S-isoprenylcysteine O-methyltransferase Ste14
MQLIPEHYLGFQNVWWFSLAYGILSIGIMMFLPKERRKRILTFPKFNSKFEKILSGLSLFVFGRGLIVYSIFIPVILFNVYFFIGIFVYLIGMISSVYAMWSFSQAELSTPITNGIYKITRHPMQIMGIIMWIGIGIAAGNWILIACAFLLGVVSYPSLKAQERFCIEKYGEDYINYMKKTPRYILF